jgi:hypothetical protein
MGVLQAEEARRRQKAGVATGGRGNLASNSTQGLNRAPETTYAETCVSGFRTRRSPANGFQVHGPVQKTRYAKRISARFIGFTRSHITGAMRPVACSPAVRWLISILKSARPIRASRDVQTRRVHASKLGVPPWADGRGVAAGLVRRAQGVDQTMMHALRCSRG